MSSFDPAVALVPAQTQSFNWVKSTQARRMAWCYAALLRRSGAQLSVEISERELLLLVESGLVEESKHLLTAKGVGVIEIAVLEPTKVAHPLLSSLVTAWAHESLGAREWRPGTRQV